MAIITCKDGMTLNNLTASGETRIRVVSPDLPSVMSRALDTINNRAFARALVVAILIVSPIIDRFFIVI